MMLHLRRFLPLCQKLCNARSDACAALPQPAAPLHYCKSPEISLFQTLSPLGSPNMVMSICIPASLYISLFPFAGGAEGQTVGSQFPRDPTSSLQGGQLGEPAESAAFQPEGLTEPQNSVGAGALINQMPAAAPIAGSPAVLPVHSQEDIKASLAVYVMHGACCIVITPKGICIPKDKEFCGCTNQLNSSEKCRCQGVGCPK